MAGQQIPYWQQVREEDRKDREQRLEHSKERHHQCKEWAAFLLVFSTGGAIFLTENKSVTAMASAFAWLLGYVSRDLLNKKSSGTAKPPSLPLS